MASRIELTKQYMGYQQNQQTDEMLAMLADDVTITVALDTVARLGYHG